MVRRLEDRGLVERSPAPEDRRASDVRLTAEGRQAVQAAAPGHVTTVRERVIDALTDEQVAELTRIADAILPRLDPEGTMSAVYNRYDEPGPDDDS